MSLATTEAVERTINSLVAELVAAMVNGRIYWSDHPRVQASIDAIQRMVLEITAQAGHEVLNLTVTDGYIVYRQRPLLGATMTATRLIEAIETAKGGGLRLSSQATKENMRALVSALLGIRDTTADYVVINKELERIGAGCVGLLPPYRERTSQGGALDEVKIAGVLHVPVQLYQNVMELLQGVTVAVCQGGKIRFESVRATAEEVLQRLVDDDERTLSLARHDQYDAFTFGHSVRVAVLALHFGRALTNRRESLIRLGTAALLHDVGKSLIPFEVLHSRAVLTDEEREIMQTHAELGAQILVDHDDADPASIAVAFGHHHRENSMGGYPQTMHEHHLSTTTKIVKICDVYEALTAARPYKRPMTPARAYRVMMAMDDYFDRGLLRKFVGVNGIHPAGQLVELSSGERGEIVRQTEALSMPVVRILRDRAGGRIDAAEERQVDLSQTGAQGTPITVVRPLEPDEFDVDHDDLSPHGASLPTALEFQSAQKMVDDGDCCTGRPTEEHGDQDG